VPRNSWRDGPYDEQLIVEPDAVRLGRLNAGAPFLNTHNDWDLSNVIGSVVPGSAKVANGIGTATIQLSSAPGDADNVKKIATGIIRNVSVGYVYHRVEKIETDNVPLWRVTDWEPLEISAVPVPADPGSQIRSSAADRSELFACRFQDSDHTVARNARLRMRLRASGLVMAR
jgi:phage head maturation protease